MTRVDEFEPEPEPEAGHELWCQSTCWAMGTKQGMKCSDLDGRSLVFELLLSFNQTFMSLAKMVGYLHGFALVLEAISVYAVQFFVGDDIPSLYTCMHAYR
eukprot:TRINITY_DN4309_c0_g2_i1.p1 TRINITY_DN4309_c0_g2~~TRINITY_DN4309_c0_g2_i1.p1  ORF type:complete len:101 (+),score=6.34 TRINITY_DN4309_c0_g2_i1:444-746(+)